MKLGKHSPSRAAVAAGLVLLSAGKIHSGGLDCGLGDVQIVLPAEGGEAAKPQSPASAQAQVHIHCKQVPGQEPPATPKARSTYPTNTPRGQVTWSTNNGKLTRDAEGNRSSIRNTSSVVVDSLGFTAR